MKDSVKSWHSTLSGAVTSAASLILALSAAGVALPRWVLVVAGFVMAGGFAAMGIVGKDASVHSTSQEVQRADEKH
jgi:hypothetical protein